MEIKKYKMPFMLSILIIFIILLIVGNSLGLAIMSIIAMLAFYYFLYN